MILIGVPPNIAQDWGVHRRARAGAFGYRDTRPKLVSAAVAPPGLKKGWRRRRRTDEETTLELQMLRTHLLLPTSQLKRLISGAWWRSHAQLWQPELRPVDASFDTCGQAQPEQP